MLLLVSPVSIHAATFNIANGDVAALISAINTAGSNGQNDTINLASGGTYTLTAVAANWDGPNGLPPLFSDFTSFGAPCSVVINGNGATIQRSSTAGTPKFRILYLHDLTIVTVNNLTIAGGEYNSGAFDNTGGGGLRISHAGVTLNQCTFKDNKSYQGGGIFIDAATTNDEIAYTVQLTSCTISRNQAGAQGGGLSKHGGALIIDGCTFDLNSLTEHGSGAGIDNWNGSLVVRNSTFSANDGGFSVGGALSNHFTREQTVIRNCTMVGNYAGQGGNCIFNDSGGTGSSSAAMVLGNTILDDALSWEPVYSTPNIRNDGALNSGGFNLCSDNGAGVLGTIGDMINTDSKLDPNGLQDNGGPTRTIAVSSDSPAVDRGNDAAGLGIDQRGQPRPKDFSQYPNASGGNGSDIGAFEEEVDPRQPYRGGQSELIVNVLGDHNDGICGGIDCTLREALAITNAEQGGAIRIPVTGTITAGSLGEFAISKRVNITGPGARLLAISGGGLRRVFSNTVPNQLGFVTTISGLTIRDGVNYSSQFSAAHGGALNNSGAIAFADCAFVGNFAFGLDGPSGGGLGGFAWGGAVYNSGEATFDRCLFNSNGADGGLGGGNTGSGSGGTGGSANGGAIYNDLNAVLGLTNCTLYNNTASGGNGGANTSAHGGAGGTSKGAGIFNRGAMTLTACTLNKNNGTGGVGGQGSSVPNNGAAGTGAGGVTSDAGSASTLRSTLVAGNTGNAGVDANGTFSTGGYNLIAVADYSTGLNAATDLRGTSAAPLDPKLDTLKNNGGPTGSFALLANSPAIDHGNGFGLTNDQRARSRPLDDTSVASATGGDGSDIGAFESPGQIRALSLVSEKYHGEGYDFFDVDLKYGMATPGVECRSGGPTNTYQFVMTFPWPVQITGSPKATVTAGSAVVGAYGFPGDDVVRIEGSTVTFFLTNVTNAQRVTVSINGVSDGINTNNVTATMRFLLGDTNGDGAVNSADIAQTKSKSGLTVDATNFRNDVNADDTLNSADISLVKSKSGTAVP